MERNSDSYGAIVLYSRLFPLFQVLAAAAEAQLHMIHTSLVNLIDEVPQTASAAEFDSKYEWMRWRSNWSWSFMQRPISQMIEAKLNDSSATRQLGYDLVHDLTQLNQSAFIVLRQQMQELQGGGASELIQSMRAAYPGIVQVSGRSTANQCAGIQHRSSVLHCPFHRY
jgi:hypothetical protein